VQLNIVTFIDVRRASVIKSIHNNAFMMDNSPKSRFQGTPHLQTVCKPGQTLNWIIYPIETDKRPNGKWPPYVRINNLIFLAGNGEDVSNVPICAGFKIYGGPDKMRSDLTPVYYYWAGTVLSDLLAGVYRYRCVLELDTEDPSKKLYLNLNTPSLKVIPLTPTT
jgi:hypothetical protein